MEQPGSLTTAMLLDVFKKRFLKMDLRLRILTYCWGEASSLPSLRVNKHHPAKKEMLDLFCVACCLSNACAGRRRAGFEPLTRLAGVSVFPRPPHPCVLFGFLIKPGIWVVIYFSLAAWVFFVGLLLCFFPLWCLDTFLWVCFWLLFFGKWVSFFFFPLVFGSLFTLDTKTQRFNRCFS